MIDEAQINSLDGAVQAGQDVTHGQSKAEFMLGDLVNLVVGLYGQKTKLGTSTMRDFATRIGVGYRRLAEYSRVCRYVSPDLRDTYPKLLFGHWKAMIRGGLRDEALDVWAAVTHDSEYTITKLEQELRPEGNVCVDPYRWIRGIARRAQEITEYEIGMAIDDHPQEVVESFNEIISCLGKWSEKLEEAGVEL